MAMIPGGYLLLARKVIESQIWAKPPLYLKVWLYLLSRAQYREYRGLGRGQLWTSIPEIRENCSWWIGYRKVTPSKTQVFNVLEWLRNCCEQIDENNTYKTVITTTKGTQGMLVTILDYGFYQEPQNYENNADYNGEELAGATRPERQADNINKERKEINKKRKKGKEVKPAGPGDSRADVVDKIIAELEEGD